MKILLKSTLILYFILIVFGCKEKQSADLLVFNAQIQTVDSALNTHTAMVISDGTIQALGTEQELRELWNVKSEYDANEHYIYPGFHDAHCHFYGYGLMQIQYADLTQTLSFEEVMEVTRNHAEELPQDDWILARGWDQNDWEIKEMPTNEILNTFFPDRAVLLIRIDGHAAIANDYLLKQAGFSVETNIQGGQLLQANGKLTGVLLDNAADSLKHMIPEASEELIRQSLLRAQKDCFAVGLTALTDAGLKDRTISIIEEMMGDEELWMRMDVMLSNHKATLDNWLPNGIYRTDYLRIGSVKVYADGALGSRGACLLHDYHDRPGHRGLMIHHLKELESVCKQAYDAGFQVNAHAIGDSAARVVLNTYSKYLQNDNDRRWRMEHAQVIHPDDFHYFGDYNIIPAVNTTHATSDMNWAEDRLGPHRIKFAYAYQKLLQENQWLTNGSDFPIEGINPLDGFYAGIKRQDHKGFPEGGFQMENAWSREEALKAMTIWAAKGSFEENYRGSLEVGKYADFVVLDTDLLDEKSDILKAKVIATYINGMPMYINENK